MVLALLPYQSPRLCHVDPPGPAPFADSNCVPPLGDGEKAGERWAEEQAQAQALGAEMAALRLENAELAFSQRLLESMLAVRLRLHTCACACTPAPAPMLLFGGERTA